MVLLAVAGPCLARPATTSQPADLRERPYAGARVRQQLPAQTRIEVLRRSGFWLYVRVVRPGGARGWLKLLKVRFGEHAPAASRAPASSSLFSSLARLSRSVTGLFGGGSRRAPATTTTIDIRDLFETLVNAGLDVYARGLDRDDELEADRDGAVLVTRAGYEPHGLAVLLLTLAEVNPAEDKVSLFNRTHPPTRERLERLNREMGARFDGYADLPLLSRRFRAMRHRLGK